MRNFSLLFRCMMVTALAFFVQDGFAQKYLLVGSANDTTGLSANERAAYRWAMNQYGTDAGYMSFSNIGTMGVPANTEAIWFHLNDTTGIRSDAASVASTIETYVTNGGGLFLSGHATHYVTNTNVTATGPTEVINNNAATADDAWGFRPLASAATHPVFDGLPATTWVNPGWSGFQTVTNGTQGYENMS